MLHRLLAVVGYPAHLLNRQLAGPLGRLGLARLPGAFVVGLVLAVLAVTTATATREAYEARPEPRASTVSELVEGDVVSGLWVVFDAVLLDGPLRTTVDVFAGPQSREVERLYYLVGDPASSRHALVVRAREPIPALEEADGPVRLDGTITEDAFAMSSLLAGWDPGARHPDVRISDTRYIAFAFATPWREPSWLGVVLLGALAAVVLVGSFVRQPILRPVEPGAGARGRTPISVAIHGELATPRGRVVLRGTPARLDWMNVEEVARTRWRYWGAALGDVRGDVEAAVRAHGGVGERLVLHGPIGSVIWPIEDVERLRLAAGDAFLGTRRMPALRVDGDDIAVTLTFADDATRDAALAEVRAADDAP